MSQENVDLVKRFQPSGLDLVEVFSAGADRLVSADDAELFTDDFEVAFSAEAAGGQARQARGADGLTVMWREWLTPWKSYRLDVERFIDAGDAVVVFARVQARTQRDDVLVQHSPAATWKIREGRIAAIHFYLQREEALEAVGLTTQDAYARS
jgi:ketosteroid isomerase-like protein